jgi:hypothetical protein
MSKFNKYFQVINSIIETIVGREIESERGASVYYKLDSVTVDELVEHRRKRRLYGR